ncbi:hypothetical protein EVAR_36266_1 [Eumeta japonica]|uniref:Uncharacterized protein n=1 Tax=Eumeta variegata TaxID=151549 RepID=A0A4C1WXB7_EUMVA|nr:hypothetical protein EVAR_36266_1 [Eumeta japonica]
MGIEPGRYRRIGDDGSGQPPNRTGQAWKSKGFKSEVEMLWEAQARRIDISHKRITRCSNEAIPLPPTFTDAQRFIIILGLPLPTVVCNSKRVTSSLLAFWDEIGYLGGESGGWKRTRAEWAGTLTHLAKGNHESCYFTFIFCENV